MADTTHPSFGSTTEAVEVASAFADSIRGRTILITGVNRQGIGHATAEAFACQAPRCLILAGRSLAKVQDSVGTLSCRFPDITYRPLLLDLSSQHSVRKAASEVLAWSDVPTLDVLVNNAGVMWLPERELTEEGIEMTLAVNHVGHFLLANLIMPKLLAATKIQEPGAVRIINVSSTSTYISPIRFSDLSWSKPASDLPENERPNLKMMQMFGVMHEGRPVDESMSYVPIAAYGQSKTANILFTVGLNKRLFRHQILSVALHPGEIRTELARYVDKVWYENAHRNGDFKTAAQGAATTMVAALDPKLQQRDHNATSFLSDCQLSKKPPAPPYATNPDLADRLWKMSEDFVGEEFAWK